MCKPCEAAKKAIHIVQGNVARIIKNEETEKLANQRRPICEGCSNKRNLIKINNKQQYYCYLCKCPIESKIRVKDELCPAPERKW